MDFTLCTFSNRESRETEPGMELDTRISKSRWRGHPGVGVNSRTDRPHRGGVWTQTRQEQWDRECRTAPSLAGWVPAYSPVTEAAFLLSPDIRIIEILSHRNISIFQQSPVQINCPATRKSCRSSFVASSYRDSPQPPGLHSLLLR